MDSTASSGAAGTPAGSACDLLAGCATAADAPSPLMLTVNELTLLDEAETARVNKRIGKLHGKVADELARECSVPTAVTSFSTAMTSAKLRALLSAIRRSLREGRTLSEASLAALQPYIDAGWGEMYQGPPGADGRVSQLWLAIQSPDAAAFMKDFPDAAYVAESDFTHSATTAANLHLGAIMGVVPQAGGMAVPLTFFIYLAGAGVRGEKTAAQEFFFNFAKKKGLVHRVMVSNARAGPTTACPPPAVTPVYHRRTTNWSLYATLHPTHAVPGQGLDGVSGLLAQQPGGAQERDRL
jgi:hypothetical protein